MLPILSVRCRESNRRPKYDFPSSGNKQRTNILQWLRQRLLLGPFLLPAGSEDLSRGTCQLEVAAVAVVVVAAATAARMAYSEVFVGDQILGSSVVRIVPMSKSTSIVVRCCPYRSRICHCRFTVICGVRNIFFLPWLRIFCAVVIAVRHLGWCEKVGLKDSGINALFFSILKIFRAMIARISFIYTRS